MSVQILEEQCVRIDNQYWSYGDYKTVHDVSDYEECCRLCKEDPECENFSYGKEGYNYGKQCYKKRGGNLGSSAYSQFISSPRYISECSCLPQGWFYVLPTMMLECNFVTKVLLI